MPILSHLHQLFNADTCYAYIEEELVTGSVGLYGSRGEHFSADAPVLLW